MRKRGEALTEKEKTQIYELRLKGAGYKAISAMLGLSRDQVRGYCKRNGLEGDPSLVVLNLKERQKQNLVCAHCGVPIQQKSTGRVKKFCTDQCRRKWWQENPQEKRKSKAAIYTYICAECGQLFSVYGNSQRKYCSHQCYIRSRFLSD